MVTTDEVGRYKFFESAPPSDGEFSLVVEKEGCFRHSQQTSRVEANRSPGVDVVLEPQDAPSE